MEKEKMNLQEATLKALYDQLDDSKDIDEVEGLVDNILVVTDPKINTEEYEEVIERAQEIVEDTPEGEIPFDEEWEGQYLQTCPICGATFVTDEILEPGAICPVCTQVPEAFVMVGRVETDEQVAKENNIDMESENEEENIEGTEFKPETFEDEEEIEEPNEEEKVEASEEVKSSENKLEENKEIITEAKSIDDFYTAFNWESFYNYIKDNLADHLFLSSVPNDNKYAFSVKIYDKSLENDFSNYPVAELKYDKQNKKIEIQFFEVIDDKIDYSQEIEITDIDEALDKINSYKYDYSIFKKESKNIAETETLDEDVEILEEDRLNFKKYGIERAPDLDFLDDGNRFRGYRCVDVPISYLKDPNYGVFLSIHVGDLGGLTYDEYSKLPSYKDCDKYNGVPENEVDLADVVEICKRIKAEYEEALKNVKDVSDDDFKAYTDKYLEKAKQEFEEAKKVIKSLEPEDLLNASEWNIKEIKRDLESIKNEINRWTWERKSKTDQTSRRRELGYDSEENFKKVSYWLRDLKEIINEITLKRTESLHENKESDIKDIMEIVNEGKEIIEEDEYSESELKADYDDLKALRVASDALQDLWDAIEGGESEFLGSYKNDIAEASDTIDNILKKAELSNMEAVDIADEEIDDLIADLDESKKIEESAEEEIDAFDKQLEEAGITTTNKLYYVTRTPKDCHTIEDADNWYRSDEGKKKWGYSYTCWEKDKADITPEQYKLIDDNRELAEDILIRAWQHVNSYGPLD